NMVGALRLVSVEQGYDPREFALIGFGGAGPLHANALARLVNSWPAIVPPGPGVLCAYGDATTRVRDEASRTYIKRFSRVKLAEVIRIFERLAKQAEKTLEKEGVKKKDRTTTYQADIRYHGQGLLLTVDFELSDLKRKGLDLLASEFDDRHTQLFTFALENDKEFVNLRAVSQGKEASIAATKVGKGSDSVSAKAKIGKGKVFVEGKNRFATLYDRSKLLAGNKIEGPAIVLEMDSTTVILPDHTGTVDDHGNILINPS
ncbi:MAG: hydantoinase/oxoprolinase family protein, partial [Pseudomonadota bacterium]